MRIARYGRHQERARNRGGNRTYTDRVLLLWLTLVKITYSINGRADPMRAIDDRIREKGRRIASATRPVPWTMQGGWSLGPTVAHVLCAGGDLGSVYIAAAKYRSLRCADTPPPGGHRWPLGAKCPSSKDGDMIAPARPAEEALIANDDDR